MGASADLLRAKLGQVVTEQTVMCSKNPSALRLGVLHSPILNSQQSEPKTFKLDLLRNFLPEGGLC